MTRPDLPANPITPLGAIVRAHAEAEQPLATFRAVDRAMGEAIGHKLFTILIHHPGLRQSERFYSNQPGAYPVGGRKPVTDAPWMQRVIQGGEIFIGYSDDDIKSVFFDHELIRSLGCESVLNVPVRWRGQTLGTLNLLHEAGWYRPADEAVARAIAHLALPAMLLIAQQ